MEPLEYLTPISTKPILCCPFCKIKNLYKDWDRAVYICQSDGCGYRKRISDFKFIEEGMDESLNKRKVNTIN